MKVMQLTHNGETLTIAQWSERIGLSGNMIRKRIKAGWTTECVLNPHKHPNAKQRRVERQAKKAKSNIDRSFNRLVFVIDMALRDFKQSIEDIANDDTRGGRKLSKNHP